MKQTPASTIAQALGIIPWRLRQSSSEIQNTNTDLLLIVPETEINHPVLLAILKSLSAHQVTIAADTNTLTAAIEQHQPVHLLCFGETLNTPINTPVHHTHTLSALEKNPAFKRETFNLLKTLGFYQ
jgi:DNA polymerase III psi subunit